MRYPFILCVMAFLALGCLQEEPIGGDTDEHGCLVAAGYSWCDLRGQCLREWEEPCRLTLEDALGVAWSGPCMENGRVSGADAVYNNNTDTWWLVLEANRSGCNPACVVHANRTSEINWRCTGYLPPGNLTESQAMAIAKASACMGQGNLTGEGYYNNYTHTWWFDMDTQKPGCSPACVVDDLEGSAQINWRCTGLRE